MLAAAAFVLLMASAQAQESSSDPGPDEVIVVWGSVEARKELEETLYDLGYKVGRTRRGEEVVLRSTRRDQPTIILHDSGWMELREGAFQANTPLGKTLSRAMTLNFVNPRKVLGAKGKVVERTWPLVTLWQAALAAEGLGDPDRLPSGADLDAALAALGWDGSEYAQPDGIPTLDERIAARGHMVDFRIGWTGLATITVQDALRDVPREIFLEREHWASAYDDRPLEDGDGRPVTAPAALAWQLKSSGAKAGERVLELSRESGYRAAVLASMGALVTRVESEPAVAFTIADRLEALNLAVPVERGPLEAGWAAGAPYELIIVEDAPELQVHSLAEQLVEGGRILVIDGHQISHHRNVAGVLTERRLLPLGTTVPLHDLPWVPDAGGPTMDIEEHTPGFDPPVMAF